MKQNVIDSNLIITAGSTYLDIDAYACCVAMAELLQLQGRNAIAYSKAPCNYSVCKSLIKAGQISEELPSGVSADDAKYIIVDVSDPDFLKSSVPLDNVIGIYDHHVGFEEYWTSRIGDASCIEFIGAAATLIYREWKKAGLQDKMSRSTALLLVAAILDNTLNLTSSNTAQEDIEAFNELCFKEGLDGQWCASYFSEVQSNVESDLKNAIFGDIKTVRNNPVLPSKVAQACVWDADKLLLRLPDTRAWFSETSDSWMLNVIDIKHKCSYFVCDNECYQAKIEKTFDAHFEGGVARMQKSYLRKEIIRNSLNSN